MVRLSTCMATESIKGMTTYTPGPATLRKRPRRNSATCSHCAATRTVDAAATPAVADASTVNTLSSGNVTANTTPKPIANISSANPYTPARLASFSVTMLSGDSCGVSANTISPCSTPRRARIFRDFLIRTSPLLASPPPRRHRFRSNLVPCIAQKMYQSIDRWPLSHQLPRSRWN